MGWSMKGILTSALGSLGGAAENWASRGIAEDAKIRDQERVDAIAEARENRQDALQRARTEAASDYAEAKANRIEERKREAQKTILAEGAAGAAADNLTPGTPAYNRYMGDYLNQQGHSDLGEKYIGHAEKGDEFGLKSELNDYKMTHGGGRGGGGGGGANERAANTLDSKEYAGAMNRVARNAVFQPTEAGGKPDDSGVASAQDIFDTAIEHGRSPREAEAIVHQVRAVANKYKSENPGMSGYAAYEKATLELKKNTPAWKQKDANDRVSAEEAGQGVLSVATAQAEQDAIRREKEEKRNAGFWGAGRRIMRGEGDFIPKLE